MIFGVFRIRPPLPAKLYAMIKGRASLCFYLCWVMIVCDRYPTRDAAGNIKARRRYNSRNLECRHLSILMLGDSRAGAAGPYGVLRELVWHFRIKVLRL